MTWSLVLHMWSVEKGTNLKHRPDILASAMWGAIHNTSLYLCHCVFACMKKNICMYVYMYVCMYVCISSVLLSMNEYLAGSDTMYILPCTYVASCLCVSDHVYMWEYAIVKFVTWARAQYYQIYIQATTNTPAYKAHTHTHTHTHTQVPGHTHAHTHTHKHRHTHTSRVKFLVILCVPSFTDISP